MPHDLSKRDLCIIVGHRRPDFPIWEGWHYVTRKPENDGDFFLTAESDPRLSDSIVGEYHHLFSLSSQIALRSDFSNVRIAQYRRLVVNKPMGVTAIGQPWTKIINQHVARSLDARALTTPGSTGFLISSIHRVPSILADYDSSHVVRDFFRFLAETVDAGILTDHEATNAALLDGLIPAPSNGTFPFPVFIKIMTMLEKAAIRFAQHGFITRDGYQRRSLGFCLERLNSFLLLRELFQRGIAFSDAEGHQLTFSEESSVSVTR